jgi:hydroxymethylglutaryl-CoA lyase
MASRQRLGGWTIMMVKRVEIREVGPREGFQIEPPGIAAQRKAELINALARSGVPAIQTVSFVNPAKVPQMADAEDVLRLVEPVPNVTYTALWFNVRGFERAREFPFLTLNGTISLSASKAFAEQNWDSRGGGALANLNSPLLDQYADLRVPVTISVAAAFGCNFQGRVPTADVLAVLLPVVEAVRNRGLTLSEVILSDTMGWANPLSVAQLTDLVRGEVPGVPLRLHLHDTRGMGIANAVAGIQKGVTLFDSSIAGLGGCPFAGHRGAAGNIATEDFVLTCHEMGIDTGIDTIAILEASRMAADIVGHPGAGRTLAGGFLSDSGVIYQGSAT